MIHLCTTHPHHAIGMAKWLSQVFFSYELTDNGCLAFFIVSAGDLAVKGDASPGFMVTRFNGSAAAAPTSVGISKTIRWWGHVPEDCIRNISIIYIIHHTKKIIYLLFDIFVLLVRLIDSELSVEILLCQKPSEATMINVHVVLN